MAIDRPIPAFYCCYLLRSTIRGSSVYVGSTPNPVRRLRQHNGIAKGGAVRTSRQSLRPWEMTCIVTGFPSHIAALQFEWAWQNPHVTQHIPADSRIQHSTQKKRSGQPKRPRHSVSSLLSNLHLLLRVPSFARWPLELRFLSSDVHKSWQKWCKTLSEHVPDSLTIITDFPPVDPISSGEEGSPSAKKRKIGHGIRALDVNYEGVKAHVEKGKSVVDFEREGACTICKEGLDHDAGVYTICPNPGCEAVSHITCLSKHFLKDDEESLLPTKGTCPSCKDELRWVDIVKELSLRMRGQKEVEKLLKAKRVRKTKVTASQRIVEDEEDNDEDDPDDEISENDFEDKELDELRKLNSGTGAGILEGDTWHTISDSEDSDAGSIVSNMSQGKKGVSLNARKAGTLGSVIEDSDWDDADIVE